MTTQPDLLTVAPIASPALAIARRDYNRAVTDVAANGDHITDLWLAQATENLRRLEAEEIARARTEARP